MNLKFLTTRLKQIKLSIGREAAKISTLSSKHLSEKYEYLTDKDLGDRPSVPEKTKFEYSSFGAILANNFKKKINTHKVNSEKKQDKDLIYNSQHSFTKFKDTNEFKEFSLGSMCKKLNDFKNKFNKLKAVNPQIDENKVLKPKVLGNVGDLFN